MFSLALQKVVCHNRLINVTNAETFGQMRKQTQVITFVLFELNKATEARVTKFSRFLHTWSNFPEVFIVSPKSTSQSSFCEKYGSVKDEAPSISGQFQKLIPTRTFQ